MFEEPSKPVSTEINRSIAEVIDSVTAVAGSTADIVEKLSSLVVRNESRDELFNREIRQAQSYLIEFRRELGNVNKDQVGKSLQLDNVLTSTASILLKVEELNKDLTRYLYESKDQLFDRYQRISDVFSTQVADLKRIHEEMQDRATKSGFCQGDMVARLDSISNIVKSCDASLSAMNRNLPQDLAEALEGSHEQRMANLEAKLDRLLRIAYKEAEKDEEGKDLDGFTKFGHWVLSNLKAAIGKVLAEILIFVLIWFYYLSGKLESSMANAVKAPVQQVIQQVDSNKKQIQKNTGELGGVEGQVIRNTRDIGENERASKSRHKAKPE